MSPSARPANHPVQNPSRSAARKGSNRVCPLIMLRVHDVRCELASHVVALSADLHHTAAVTMNGVGRSNPPLFSRLVSLPKRPLGVLTRAPKFVEFFFGLTEPISPFIISPPIGTYLTLYSSSTQYKDPLSTRKIRAKLNVDFSVPPPLKKQLFFARRKWRVLQHGVNLGVSGAVRPCRLCSKPTGDQRWYNRPRRGLQLVGDATKRW